MSLSVLHRGAKSDQARALQAATNRRLRARGLGSFVVREDGFVGVKTLAAVRKAAWALGALGSTYESITKDDEVPAGVQWMIRNPGRRTNQQVDRGKRRIAAMYSARKKREQEADSVSGDRKAIVTAAKKAAANYRKNPVAYHYLAGGKANTVIMDPTPSDWRSDCSQFAVNVYRVAGVPCPGSGTYLYSNTDTINNGGKVVSRPKPGDLGMYGRRDGSTHHVEVYIGEPGCMFVGHGSVPIDAITPGLPDFYLSFLD